MLDEKTYNVSEYQKNIEKFYAPSNHAPELHEHIYQRKQYIGQLDFWSADEILRFGNLLNINNESKILDFGTGLGGPLCHLISNFHCKGIGIDITESNIMSANNRSKILGIEKNVEFLYGDANSMKFHDNEFDAIMFIESIVHMNDRLNLMKSCRKYLKDDGKVLIALECVTNNVPIGLKLKRDKLGMVISDIVENYRRLFYDSGFDIDLEEVYKTKRFEFAIKALEWMKEVNNLNGFESMNTIKEISELNYAHEYLFVLRKRKIDD